MTIKTVKTPIGDQRLAAIKHEGWELETRLEDVILNGQECKIEKKIVWAYGMEFPVANPLSIYLAVYRRHDKAEVRLDAMRHAHHLLWPDRVLTWNYWQERMFGAHCEKKQTIVFAGGAGIGKTSSASEIGTIFWLSNPSQRAVIVASTTIDSLKSRIFGYIVRNLKSMTADYKFTIERSLPPKVHPTVKDDIHGIYAVAATKGDDEETIKNWIGRHPEDALLLILDEAPDLPIAIMPAMSNLSKGLPGGFQALGLGNSNDKVDLHGALATPALSEGGWDGISPHTHTRWNTTHPDGICLYFNPYESPAVHETDPEKKAALSGFLMTSEKLVKAEQEEGINSEDFWRFTMGFWKGTSSENIVVSEALLKEYKPTDAAHFSGMYPLVLVAGLDPAFSMGGDKCILRIGVLGHTVTGKVVLDYRKEQFVFNIKLMANTGLSAELQIADAVIKILRQYKIPIHTLCIDASGAGRGLADIIQLRSNALVAPTKIFSTNIGAKRQKTEGGITMAYDQLWDIGRKFITHGQIKGLDAAAYVQLYSRQTTIKNGKTILEPKDEYRKRMTAIGSIYSGSPDEADAAMLCLQAAIIHHGFYLGQQVAMRTFKSLTDETYYKATEELRETNAKKSVPSFKANYGATQNSLLRRRFF